MTGSIEAIVCEQATGCKGAGDFREWARQQGYPFCEVLNWTSSAGDWSFLVSRDGKTWHPMWQSNNYPKPGFSRIVEETVSWDGTVAEAVQMAALELEA